MKKIFTIALTVLAVLTIMSCSAQSNEIFTDELVEVSLNANVAQKALEVQAPEAAYYMYRVTPKWDKTKSYFEGEMETWIRLDESFNSTGSANLGKFSQGEWTIEVKGYAATGAFNRNGEPVFADVSGGSTTLIVQANKDNVASITLVASEGTGRIAWNITSPLLNYSEDAVQNILKVTIDGTKSESEATVNTGIHTVKFEIRDAESNVLASQEVKVRVYKGQTTTISGTIYANEFQAGSLEVTGLDKHYGLSFDKVLDTDDTDKAVKFTLSCTEGFSGKETFAWYKNGEPLTESGTITGDIDLTEGFNTYTVVIIDGNNAATLSKTFMFANGVATVV